MSQKSDGIDAGALTLGALMGLLLGGLAALFLNPRSGPETRRQITSSSQELREQLEQTIVPPDPLEESMAEGKAAARRRRDALGLDK